MDLLNVLAKFEIRSFSRSWDNRGYPPKWAVPGYAHTPFSPKFLIGFCSDGPTECTGQIWSSYSFIALPVPEIIVQVLSKRIVHILKKAWNLAWINFDILNKFRGGHKCNMQISGRGISFSKSPPVKSVKFLVATQCCLLCLNFNVSNNKIRFS